MLSYRRLQPYRKYYPLIMCCFLGLTIFKFGIQVIIHPSDIWKERSYTSVASNDTARSDSDNRNVLITDNNNTNNNNNDNDIIVTVFDKTVRNEATKQTQISQTATNIISHKYVDTVNSVTSREHEVSVAESSIDRMGARPTGSAIPQKCINPAPPLLRSHFAGYKDIINSIHVNVLIPPANVCGVKNTDPYLLIIISSMEEDFRYRDTIRNTWASTTKIENITIGRVFIVASNSTTSLSTDFLKEVETHGDILLLDMEETYRNLIYKVFAGMTYMTDTCKGTRFLLKVDIDVYVHLPKLTKLLLANQGAGDVVIGNEHRSAPVFRQGRWGVTYEQYKFCKYIPYTEGNSYVISAELVPKLLDRALYIPLIHNEDAFITGILRYAVDGKIVHVPSFSQFKASIDRTKLGKFYTLGKVSETRCSIEMIQELWLIYSETSA